MRPVKYTLLLLFILWLPVTLWGQAVPYHLGNASVYQFLDELANAHIIDLNPAARPYTRKTIAEALALASLKIDSLNPGQKKQLDFLLRDFNKELTPASANFKKRHDLFYHKDSLFTLSVNPSGGFRYWSNKNDRFYHRQVGAEAFAYMGPHVGLYASLTDNTENRFLSLPTHLTTRTGGVYKHGPGAVGGDFSEARGGITYSWKWGHAGIRKDHFAWGSNYHGANIFSGRAPSFPFIQLHMKPTPWFEFNYVHGFLVSDVLDTSRSYVAGVKERSIFFPKFLAANLYTFNLLDGLKVSIGNSIVYSDEFQLAYLVPVYFFKSVDHSTANTSGNFTGQNSQMYLDVNSRQFRYLNIYLSVFVDEVNIGNFWKSDKQSNFFSMKAGAALSPPFAPGTTFIFEYTRTHPGTYKHFVNTTTFASNDFNLGHYLGDHAGEIYTAIRYRPIRGMYIETSFTQAVKGEDFPYLGTGGSGLGWPYLEKIFWKNRHLRLSVTYEVVNDAFIFAGIDHRRVTGDAEYLDAYTPSFWHGVTTTLSGGVRLGM